MSRNLYPVPDEPGYDEQPAVSDRAADLGAERIVLGAMMLAPSVIPDVRAIVTPDQFYDWRHELIAAAIYRLHDDRKPTGAEAVRVALGEDATTRGKIHSAYLIDLIDAVPIAAQAGYFAEIVRKTAMLRAVATTGTQLASLGSTRHTSIDDVDIALTEGIERLRGLQANVPDLHTPATAASLLDEALERIEHPDPVTAGIATGLYDLDAVLGGLRPGQLILVAARPGVGKTIVLMNFARHAAILLGTPTLYVSLEMLQDSLMRRIISAEAKVNHDRLRDSTCTETDWARIAAAAGPITNSKLFIDDTPRITAPQLRRKIRALKDNHGLGLVVVDYLQLMQAPKAENRQVAVAELSRELKLTAAEFGIPLVAASQLNRESERRVDKRPAMSDLRESGALEQDADVVLLLHREDAHDRESPKAGEMELDVAKNRDGAQAMVRVAFQGHYQRVSSLASSPAA